ncbi:hypothetical protein BDW59DRAFT_153123 [Aspergillus cavernicola]|uniref:Uncharacterized protein n=1 Tax=Aspergillus cavernicola TaxID=176166 RepID=A0ABR4HME3_9EURO
MPLPPPPPPPPPPSAIGLRTNNTTIPHPPSVPPHSPPNSFRVSLLIYNGHPFNDHWAYFVQSHANPDLGVKIHATGSVSTGFLFEVKRNHNLRDTEDVPTKSIPLHWVDGILFNETDMLGDGGERIDHEPTCGFERSVYKAKVPGKSLMSVSAISGEEAGRRKIVQRDCQTWIVESADQLVVDGIFVNDVADYLRAIQQ